MRDNSCFVCGARPANPAHPVIVGLKKASQTRKVTEFVQVEVPACGICGPQQYNGERIVNGIALSIMLAIGIGAGINEGFLAGLIGGLVFGWIPALIITSIFGGRQKSCKHPKVLELMKGGWRFNNLYVK